MIQLLKATYEKAYLISNLGDTLNATRSDRGMDAYREEKEGVGPRFELIGPTKTALKQVRNYNRLAKLYEDKGDKEKAEEYEQKMLTTMRRYSTRYNQTIFGD